VLAVLALFFAPALVGSGQFLHLDTGAMHHPVKSWIAGELRAGHLPEWNPYLGLGVPVVAGAIDGVFHPFSLLLLLLPFEAAFRLWVLLSYALAAVGAFAWARRLGAAPAAAAAAALAYALSGYLVSSSANLTFLTGLAALPLLLAAAHGFVERPGPGRLAQVVAAGFLAATAGDPQSFVLVAAVLPVAAVATVASTEPPGTRALRGAIATAFALAGAAPVLVPLAAWVPHSSRAEPLDPVDLGRFNLHPLRLIELVVPHLLRGAPGAASPAPYLAFARDPYTVRPWVQSVHVGAATAALALYATSRSKAARALVAAAAITAWIALGPHAGFAWIAQWLPLLGRFRFWEKLAALLPLALAAAAAIGADALGRAERPRRAGAIAGATGAAFLAATLVLVAAPEGAARSLGGADRLEAARMLVANLRGGLLASGSALLALAGVCALGGRRTVFAAAIVGAELFAASSGAWSLSPLEVARPDAPLAGFLQVQPGLQRVVSGGPDPDGAQVARADLTEYEQYARWYARRLDAAFNVRWRIGNLRNYVALVPARAMRFERRRYGRPLTTGAGLLGIGHAVVPADAAAAAAVGVDPAWPVVATDPEARLALRAVPHRPRAYLAASLRAVDRRGAMEFLLHADPGSDESVVEGQVPMGYSRPEGEAAIALELPERIGISVRTDRAALLVLNDVFAEGWTAAVDGRQAEILPANYLARGVWVPPGRHEVVFTYRTPGLLGGWLVFLCVGLALSGWSLRSARSRGATARVKSGLPPG